MDEKGIINKRKLPDKEFEDLWERIFVSNDIKDRLISQILLEFTLRGRFPVGAVPLHGIILLVGPPGTGKTSLAKAVASKAASMVKGSVINFIEIEPHSLTSSALGKSQREVTNLLHEKIPEYASQGPLIVLLDEVETLATDRQKLSMDANPIDVHRSTDALLAGIDILSSKYKNLVFIATSNFEGAIDSAFISRADLIQTIGLPNRETCGEIIKDTLITLSDEWTEIKKIIRSPKFAGLVNLSVGLDGRQLRKAVLFACALRKDIALDPNLLTVELIEESIKQFKRE